MSRSVSIRRRVAWIDTDAAGIWHHTTATRWMEEAEAELHRDLGIIDETFGATPRVHIELSFLLPLDFDEVVDIHLLVASMGVSSVTYEMSVERDGEIAVTGRMTAVLIDRDTKQKRPWPDHLRAALSGAR